MKELININPGRDLIPSLKNITDMLRINSISKGINSNPNIKRALEYTGYSLFVILVFAFTYVSLILISIIG